MVDEKTSQGTQLLASSTDTVQCWSNVSPIPNWNLFRTKAYRPQIKYRRLFQVHWSKVGFYMRQATIREQATVRVGTVCLESSECRTTNSFCISEPYCNIYVPIDLVLLLGEQGSTCLSMCKLNYSTFKFKILSTSIPDKVFGLVFSLEPIFILYMSRIN